MEDDAAGEDTKGGVVERWESGGGCRGGICMVFVVWIGEVRWFGWQRKERGIEKESEGMGCVGLGGGLGYSIGSHCIRRRTFFSYHDV